MASRNSTSVTNNIQQAQYKDSETEASIPPVLDEVLSNNSFI